MAFKIGKNCQIDPTAIINVNDGCLGDNSIVRAFARIEGTRVEIGREAFLDTFSTIGGGSCFDPEAFLKAGDWLHMGTQSQINIARGVTIGHEFGCGIETKIFTHGAYLDAYNLGAPSQWGPVSIGDNVWMPNAWVNPGIKVGSQVVVAARSLLNIDLPSGCLAGGIPAKILKNNYLPQVKSAEEKKTLIQEITRVTLARSLSNEEKKIDYADGHLLVQEGSLQTIFLLEEKKIQGQFSNFSHLLKDQLRRNGIRFRYINSESQWVPWENNSL